MIVRKTASEIERMRASGAIVAEVLEAISQAIVPNVTRTIELDQLAARLARERGAIPAFLGYRGFPANTCISVNETVVHGIPNDRVLKSGDIVSVDFACSLDGAFADAAITLPVGEISPEAERLLKVTQESLFVGIAKARTGARIGEISAAIQRFVEQNGYSVVRELVGHGVGRALHEDPAVPNFGKPGQGERLIEGMTLAIEPMVNAGAAKVETLADKWTVVTKDGALSAHFEHTVAVTKKGPEILTLPATVTEAVRSRPVAHTASALAFAEARAV
jgi:methionyl aminopeptidase